MNSDIELLAKIQNVCTSLDEIDNIIETNGERQQNVDYKLSDLEHELENSDLTNNEILSIGKKVKELRKDRRSLKNEYEIIRKYNELKQRLLEPNSRQIFKSNMNNVLKNLNQPYKNRVYTTEEIDEIKSSYSIVEQTKRTKIDLEELEKQLNSGKNQKELSKLFGCSQSTINRYLQKMGKRKKDK